MHLGRQSGGAVPNQGNTFLHTHSTCMRIYIYVMSGQSIFPCLALSPMTDSKLCLNLSSIQLALRSLPSLSYHFCIICKQSENEWKWSWNKVTLTYTVHVRTCKYMHTLVESLSGCYMHITFCNSSFLFSRLLESKFSRRFFSLSSWFGKKDAYNKQ